MRWIFLIVFSINLVYIAWQVNLPADDSYTSVQPLKNIQSIVLLSEVKQEAKQSEVKQEQVASQVDVQQTDAGQVEVLQDEALQNESAVRDTSEQEEVIAQSDVELAVDPENTEKATEKVDAELVKVDAAGSESVKQSVVAENKQADSTEGVLTETLQQPSSAGSSCFSSGPFRDLDKLRSFTREIKSYVIETDFRGSEEKESSLYWVYIEPEKSRKKAFETGKRLKAKKIKDFYVIREGEKIHGLSLGYFRNKTGAYGLANKVKKLGFKVIVEPMFKTKTIYWLDYRLISDASIPEAIFDKYNNPEQKNKVVRLSRDCS